MELWEGAALIIGGVWLVGYMSRRQAAGLNTLPGGTVTPFMRSIGTTNKSNLTTITNQAGGDMTTVGESLTPAQPNPLTGKTCPAWNCGGPSSTGLPSVAPIPGGKLIPFVTPTPLKSVSQATPIPGGILTPYMRPIDVHMV